MHLFLVSLLLYVVKCFIVCLVFSVEANKLVYNVVALFVCKFKFSQLTHAMSLSHAIFVS